MEAIHVPPPPKEAFNKHRRMSDLIKAQIGHLRHLEEKFAQEIRDTLPQHQIVTEDDAARYIAAMTSILRSGASLTADRTKRVSEIKRPIPVRTVKQISLAAAADVIPEKSPSKGRTAASRKTARRVPISGGPSPTRKK
jgi:hypothetical protein